MEQFDKSWRRGSLVAIGICAATWALLVSGCRSSSHAPASGPSVSAGDNGKTIGVRLGQEVTISLADPGDGGYVWTFGQQASPRVLTYLGPHRLSPKNSAMPGDFGTDVYRYRAAKPGTAHVVLDAERPWSHQISSVFSVSIDVSGS